RAYSRFAIAAARARSPSPSAAVAAMTSTSAVTAGSAVNHCARASASSSRASSAAPAQARPATAAPPAAPPRQPPRLRPCSAGGVGRGGWEGGGGAVGIAADELRAPAEATEQRARDQVVARDRVEHRDGARRLARVQLAERPVAAQERRLPRALEPELATRR